MPGPLDGVVVLDLSRALAGPHAAMMLGDLGARVIKVEVTGDGDDTRGWGPPSSAPRKPRIDVLPVLQPEQGVDHPRSEERRRPRDADQPGASDRRPGRELPAGRAGPARLLDGRLHELNPRLVILSITGFGHDGPEGGRAGYDQIAQGEAGLMSLTGPGRTSPPGSACPSATFSPACTAPTARWPPSMSATAPDAAGSCAPACWPRSSGSTPSRAPAGRWPARCHDAQGNHHPPSPLRVVPCTDAIIQIAVGSEGLWQKFAPLVDIDVADPRFATNANRVSTAPRSPNSSTTPSPTRRCTTRWPGSTPRGARRRGPHPRSGLRMGPDPEPGTRHRRRPCHPRSRQPARPAAASRRGRPHGARASADPRPARREHPSVARRRRRTVRVEAAGFQDQGTDERGDCSADC